MSLAKQVKEQFDQLPAGGVIASRTLHKLSPDSQQVDKAASRLYKQQGLNKLRNGLFYKPYKSKFFGDLPPREEEVLRSIREQHDVQISPSGALAAYEMGLATDLPESIIYESDKRISPINLGNHILYFRKVDGKKLFAVEGSLLKTLKALEFLYKENKALTPLQEKRIQRLLSRYPSTQLANATALWPRWFQDETQDLIKTIIQPYITGLSALNIPYQGKQADWHQMGMLNNNKFQIAGKNYESAPGLTDKELFDCSDFLSKHDITMGTNLCATPLRAIKDILFTSILKKNQYPSFFMLDQLMLDIPSNAIKEAVDELLSLANDKQKKLLITWVNDNELI
ncbi:DUF6088 family protein [Oceanicoccus sp. KOV_DT_Chl]|uniref:DUF6088 family protein n=1 Tax=Oceanicoccus sp. KOV_DT_Chl TaxID=1904639 RepID=UPI000C7D1AFD|nr:DUF6088 family protein [Oceanicoccus sp. KOV_DT_Chl]